MISEAIPSTSKRQVLWRGAESGISISSVMISGCHTSLHVCDSNGEPIGERGVDLLLRDWAGLLNNAWLSCLKSEENVSNKNQDRRSGAYRREEKLITN